MTDNLFKKQNNGTIKLYPDLPPDVIWIDPDDLPFDTPDDRKVSDDHHKKVNEENNLIHFNEKKDQH